MPTDINSLLAGLGINPRPPAKPHTSNASQVRALGKPKASPIVSQRNSSGRKAGTQPVRVSPVPVVNSLVAQAKDDSAWSTVGSIFGKALDFIDTPRAFVAASLYEAGNFLAEHGPSELFGTATEPLSGQSRKIRGTSLDRLASNTWSNKGTGTYVNENGGVSNRALGLGIGLVGDVVSDPLTYVTMGVSSVAEGGGKELAQALRAGGRKEISEAVAKTVLEKAPGEADKLVASAGRKGRGAITKKGLQKAGIDSAMAEKLGLPELRYELFGAKIPGSRVAAEGVANLKGGLKEWVGGTRTAKILRAKRIPETDGLLSFTNIIREASGDSAKQADAVRAMLAVTEKRAQTRKLFQVETDKLIHSDLGKTLKAPPSDLVHLSETAGVDTPLNAWLDHMHQVAVENGVDVPYRENYVPHIVTREARKASQTSEPIRVIIDSLDKKESFQAARESLGTIAEENAKSIAKHGIKLFEDDPAIISVAYLDQVERAVKRSQINEGLASVGVATPIPVSNVTEPLGKRIVTAEDVASGLAQPTEIGKTFKEVVKDTGKALDATAKAETAAAKAGVTLKEQEAIVAAAALKDQKAAALGRVREIDHQVIDLTRRRSEAESGVKLLEGKLASETRKRDGWAIIAKKDAHPRKLEAQRMVRKLNKQISELDTSLGTARESLAVLKNSDRAGRRSFANEVQNLNTERDALVSQYGEATAAVDSLKASVAPEGTSELLGAAQVDEANLRLGELSAKVGRARTNADIVTNVYDAVLADKEALMPMIDQELNDIDAALRAIPKKKNVKSLKGLTEYGADISNNLRAARELLDAANDPASKLMAQFEASAAVADARAVRLGGEVDTLQATIDSMHDPKFRTYLKQFVADGNQRINETYQIPDWVDNALQAEKVLNSPKEWGDWARGYDKTLNVLKGYMVARPGFVVRNAYSSAFNVYLEGGAGALKSIGEYERFYHILKKNPNDYLEKATAKWGAEKANMYDRAFAAQAATGFGQAADEFHVGVLSGMSANPLNQNFAPIRAIRKTNEVVEEIIRGGHALDVLKRGGSDALAVDTLEKWHFNYRDITDFDRKMKRIMPFWSFFSNNVALQAQTFPQILPKLNRTYFNLQRNLQVGQTPDTDVPKYFNDSFPLRLPGGGGPGTNTKYLFPDLPALQGVRDLQSAVDSKGLSLVAQTAPPIKLINDAILGDKNSFTGLPFQDKYQKTPFPLPGFLPGVDEGGNSGQSVWTDRTKYAYENILPTMSQVDRFGGNGNKADSLLSFLGLGTRTNTDKTRKGEQLRRARAQQAELDRVRNLGRV